MKKKMLAMLMAAAFVVTAVAGCSVPNSGEDASSEDTNEAGEEGDSSETNGESASTGEKVFRYALIEEPPTLDPTLSNSIPSATVEFHIFEGLMRDNSGEVSYAMAESHEVSDDGLTYTFTLRDGVEWSDGEPITAQDFEYGMKRLMDPATASPYSFLGLILQNGGEIYSGDLDPDELGVNALDEKTIEINIEYPATYFLSMLSMPQFCPVREDLVEEYGTDFAATADKNVYNGPFVVSEWNHNDRIILAKNENYWNADAIKLDGVEILEIADRNTMLAMYESGELDFVELAPEMAESYGDEVEYYYDGANDFLKLNQAEGELLNNKNLRLAINYAINRTEYIQLSSSGVYEANTRYVLPQVSGVEGEYGEEYPLEAFPVDGDQDTALEYLDTALEELGMSDAADIDLELLTVDTETAKKQAEVLQEQIQNALGITVTIRQVTYKQRLQMEDDSEFQMVFTGWVPDYSDPYSYLEILESSSPYNQGSYNNPDYDEYLAAGITETDPQVRMDSLFNAEKTLLEDGGLVPLQLRRNPIMYVDNLTGLQLNFVGINYDYMYADFE